MGHRHTPEEHAGARRVCRAPSGASARPARRHEAAAVSCALIGRERIGELTPRQVATQEVGSAPSVNPSHSYSVAVRAALFTLRFYKAYLSILMAGSCRFQPTCSQFTYEAITRFGVFRGSWLGFLRLLRCQPFSRRFGFDPVPEEWPVHSADLSNHKEAHS